MYDYNWCLVNPFLNFLFLNQRNMDPSIIILRDYYLYLLCLFLLKGHVVRILFTCQCCRVEKRTWSSSRVFWAHYLLNQELVSWIVFKRVAIIPVCDRIVDSFTCAGILHEVLQVCRHATFGAQIVEMGEAIIVRNLLEWR